MQAFTFRHTKVLLLSLALFLGTGTMSSMAQQVNTGEYFPLVSGYKWTYLVDGSGSGTKEILSGTVEVNGVPTKVMQSSDGTKYYFSNDASGIHEHRQDGPNDTRISMIT